MEATDMNDLNNPNSLTDTNDSLDMWEPLAFTKKKKTFNLPRPLAPLFDAHGHLRLFLKEEKWVGDLLVRAYIAGVRGIVSIYDPVADAREEMPDVAGYSAWLSNAMETIRERGDAPGLPRTLYMAGVHPYGALQFTDAHEAQLEAMLDDPMCAGVGEIGLDYHFDTDDEIESVPHDAQQEIMLRQLDIALRHNVPVQLHLRNIDGDETREAHNDALRMLRETGIPKAGCVLHCFGEDRATMEQFLELGCHVTFGGAATFKRNETVREAFAACPLDRLMLETDCPFMAPEPIRGLECEPAMIAQNADVLIYDRAGRTGELPEKIAWGIWNTTNALFA